MKKLMIKSVGVLAVLLATISASSACFWFLGQPKMPDSLRKL